MLSDALDEAGRLLDRYLAVKYWRKQYDPKLIADVDALRQRMREIQRHLDHLPGAKCGYREEAIGVWTLFPLDIHYEPMGRRVVKGDAKALGEAITEMFEEANADPNNDGVSGVRSIDIHQDIVE
jgi:hypothetical protein